MTSRRDFLDNKSRIVFCVGHQQVRPPTVMNQIEFFSLTNLCVTLGFFDWKTVKI